MTTCDPIYTAQEQVAITKYEEAALGYPDTYDGLGPDNWPSEFSNAEISAYFRSFLDDLHTWHLHIDTLYHALDRRQNANHTGPAFSDPAMTYLQRAATLWYRALGTTRREACRHAYGTAGPEPAMDGGGLDFYGIVPVPLDGDACVE